MQHVQKPAERRIAGIAQAFTRVFGDVQRQRPVRAEQAEQMDLKPRGPVVLRRSERRQRSWRKRERWILSESNRLLGGTRRVAPTRFVREQTLQPPQRLVEVVFVRRVCQCREQGQSVGLRPHSGTHRLISPRFSERNTVSVNELMDT